MGIIKDIRRYMAVKYKKNRDYCNCRLCNSLLFPGEMVYYVDRWTSKKNIRRVFYCTDCIKCKEDVLEEVVTDSIPNGIARVDDFNTFKKRDYTRYLYRKEHGYGK